MSEVKRLNMYRFISNFEKMKADLQQLEFFADTRTGALLALQNSLPAPEHADLFAQVLLDTEEEVKNPQINKLKVSLAIIERLIQKTQDLPPQTLDHIAIQEQLGIAGSVIQHYAELYQDTKLVLTSARFKTRSLPETTDRPAPQPASVPSPPSLPSNVKRMDVHRVQQYLETFIKATDELEAATTNICHIFQSTVSQEHLSSFPELAILSQGAIEERNHMLEAARVLQKAIQQKINDLNQEPLPT